MNEITVQIVSLVLMLVPFPIIVYGVLEGIAVLWWAGIVLVVVGGVIPPVTRYVFEGEGDADESDDENGSGENG